MNLLRKILLASTALVSSTSHGLIFEAQGLIVEGQFESMDGSVIPYQTQYISVIDFDYGAFSLVDSSMTEQPGGWTNWHHQFSTTASVSFQAGNYYAYDNVETAYVTLYRHDDDPAGLFQWRVQFGDNHSTSHPPELAPLGLHFPFLTEDGQTHYLDFSSGFSWFGYSTGFFGQTELDPSFLHPDIGATLEKLAAGELESRGHFLASWFGVADSSGIRSGSFNGRDFGGVKAVPDSTSSAVLSVIAFIGIFLAARRRSS